MLVVVAANLIDAVEVLVGLVIDGHAAAFLRDDVGDLSSLGLRLQGCRSVHILLILIDCRVRPRVEHHWRLVSFAAIPPRLPLRLPTLPAYA